MRLDADVLALHRTTVNLERQFQVLDRLTAVLAEATDHSRLGGPDFVHVIREVRSLDDVNDAIADVEAGRIAARIVFDCG